MIVWTHWFQGNNFPLFLFTFIMWLLENLKYTCGWPQFSTEPPWPRPTKIRLHGSWILGEKTYGKCINWWTKNAMSAGTGAEKKRKQKNGVGKTGQWCYITQTIILKNHFLYFMILFITQVFLGCTYMKNPQCNF